MYSLYFFGGGFFIHTPTRTIKEVERRFPDGVPLLDPINDMRIEDEGFNRQASILCMLEKRLQSNPIDSSPDRDKRFRQYEEKNAILREISENKKLLRDSRDMIFKDTLKNMKRVLRRLGYTNEDNVVQLKV